LGQDLCALSLGLKSLEPSVLDARGRVILRGLRSLTAEMGRNVHRAAWELHPTSLEDVGLTRALEAYVAEWSERFGFPLDFHAACDATDHLSPEIEAAAYRVVQEGLTNILKHAGASTASLVLECRGGSLRIIVEDNGKGFDADLPAGAGRFGLAGMRERLAALGGTLAIDSRIGAGTTLYVRIPLRTDEAKARDE
jgi:two-component system sensor histidine kinase UhpB